MDCRSPTPPPGGSIPVSSLPPPSPNRPKSLMESLLVAKMEQVTLGHPGRKLMRSDSADSASSFGSVNSATRSDVCRCDDCLLGIGDLWQQESTTEEKKKKTFNLSQSFSTETLHLTLGGIYPSKTLKRKSLFVASFIFNLSISWAQFLSMATFSYMNSSRLEKLSEILLFCMTQFAFLNKLTNFIFRKASLRRVEAALGNPLRAFSETYSVTCYRNLSYFYYVG